MRGPQTVISKQESGLVFFVLSLNYCAFYALSEIARRLLLDWKVGHCEFFGPRVRDRATRLPFAPYRRLLSRYSLFARGDLAIGRKLVEPAFCGSRFGSVGMVAHKVP